MTTHCTAQNRRGFSLIEVVLAIGIFLVTVLALVGLLGPTLQSVDEVEKTDEVSSVVNTVNAFLQSSSDIAPNASKFNAIYNAVGTDGFATIFVYRWFDDSVADNPVVRLEIGFVDNEGGSVDNASVVNVGGASFGNTAGPIYRVILTPSSVLPTDQVTDNGINAYPRYTLANGITDYPEGYFAMEVRIFARELDMVAATGGSMPTAALADLGNEEPLFTYNTAVVR